MKALLIHCLLLQMYISSFGQVDHRAEQSTLVHIETQRLEAILTHNHDFLTNLFDDEYHEVMVTGKLIDKATVIEFLESGHPNVIQSVEDVTSTVHGDFAFTVGKLVSKSKSGTMMGKTRFTHIYLKKKGQWKLIEGHNTVILQE